MIFYSGGSSICLAGVALWYIIETSVLAPIGLTFCFTLVLWCFPFIDLDIVSAFKIAFPLSIVVTIGLILFVLYDCIVNRSMDDDKLYKE
jgi:hypothetical protein